TLTISLSRRCDHRPLHSFPTRRSSDLPWTPGIRHQRTEHATVADAARSLQLSVLLRPRFRRHGEPVELMLTVHSDHRCSTSSARSEEHTSELQSRENLVCRLLLEKKKT